jgi:hypothetical protein
MTTTITSIGKTEAKAIGAEVTSALTAIAEKFGLTYNAKRGTFDQAGTFLRVSGEFSTGDAKRNAFNSTIRFLTDENYQPYFCEDDFGRSFKSGGRTYTISGANPRAPKFAIEADRDDGAHFGFSAKTVRSLLDASLAAKS